MEQNGGTSKLNTLKKGTKICLSEGEFGAPYRVWGPIRCIIESLGPSLGPHAYTDMGPQTLCYHYDSTCILQTIQDNICTILNTK